MGDVSHALTKASAKGATEDGTGRGTPIVGTHGRVDEGPTGTLTRMYSEQSGQDFGGGGRSDRDRIYNATAAYGAWREESEAGTLSQRDYKSTNHIVITNGGGQPGCSAFRKSRRAASMTDDETWVEGHHANTLNRFDVGDTRTTHVVVNSDSYWVEDCENAALRANGSNDGPPRTDKQPLITQTFPIDDGREIEKHQNGTGIGSAHDPAYTLDRQQRPAVVQPEKMSVRRLTPVECERLMGLPDGWTAPPGVKAPDSKRYAACGDAIVTTVAFWIADRIRMIEEEEKAS